MNNRFYPAFTWCNKYGMWCDDVPDLTDGFNECNGDCGDCEHNEDAKQK